MNARVSLSPRRVLVVGGTSGIGLAAAQRFAAAGDRVTVCGRTSPPDLPGTCEFLRLDLEKREEARRILGAWHAAGPVDVAVNCAGMQVAVQPLETLQLAEWDRIVSVNLTGVFSALQFQLREMKAQGRGVIVNVSSMWGHKAAAQVGAYVSTKFAVTGLTQAAALEAAPFGVRVNGVSPGYVRTPMLERALGSDPRAMDHLGSRVPLCRVAKPTEIAGTIFWLASDDAAYVTGADIAVDGGAGI